MRSIILGLAVAGSLASSSAHAAPMDSPHCRLLQDSLVHNMAAMTSKKDELLKAHAMGDRKELNKISRQLKRGGHRILETVQRITNSKCVS